MGSLKSLVVLSCFAFPLWANPFDRFDEEIHSYAYKNSSFSSLDTKEKQIRNLFQTYYPEEYSDLEDSSSDKEGIEPRYLKFQTIISSQIISEKGEILKKYSVKSKDTLRSIAKVHNTTVQKIQKSNKLSGDSIQIGQSLDIPVVVAQAKTYRLTKKRVFINPVPDGRTTSRFGHRRDPFNTYHRNYHSGMDMAAPVGAPIISSADGEVVFTGRNGGYGNIVIVEHANGYKTVYAHCSKILVESGEKVKMGRVIALVGRTGTATGAHLHFEVMKNGRLINPEKALNLVETIQTKIDSVEISKL